MPNDRKFNQEQKQKPNRHCSNRSISHAQTHEPLIRQQFHAKTQIMNPALFGLAIIASQFLLALALLFVAGSLIRIDLNRAEAADSRFAKIPSRFVRDLRALKDALVEFFARSNESCRILSVLVAQRKPLRLSAIVQEIQLETDRSARTLCSTYEHCLGDPLDSASVWSRSYEPARIRGHQRRPRGLPEDRS